MTSDMKRCKKCGVVAFDEEKACRSCKSRSFDPIGIDEVTLFDAIAYIKAMDGDRAYERDACLAALADLAPHLEAERNALAIAFNCGAVGSLAWGDTSAAVRQMDDAYLSSAISNQIVAAFTGFFDSGRAAEVVGKGSSNVSDFKSLPEMSKEAKFEELKLAKALIAKNTVPDLARAITVLEGIAGFEDADALLEGARELEGFKSVQTPLSVGTIVGLAEVVGKIRSHCAIDDIESFLKDIVAGSKLTMGVWNGEDIEWRVLDVEDDRALLITERAICHRPFNDKDEAVNWAGCSLRSWLNMEFMVDAFANYERSLIVETQVTNSDNAGFGTKGGPGTMDRVFCLSIDEADKYFKDDHDRTCYRLHPVQASSLRKKKVGTCDWWLRSPGNIQDFAAYVFDVGSVNEYGFWVSYGNCGVRPALWVHL